MPKKRKRKPKWYLLYRKEERHCVWLYEPLKKGELNSRKNKGWKVV